MIVTPPPKEFVKDSHCSYCGAKFTEQKVWPRKCFICWNESYKNPIPIVVTMIGVEVNNRMGILIQQRNIEPEKGNWAFPSGYINFGESWEEAAVRENSEEMLLPSMTDDYSLYTIRKPASGNMLVFCRHISVLGDEVNYFIRKFQSNEEVSALGIWYGDTKLAFPTHNEVGQDFLFKLKLTQSPWTR